jgi:hypothetical protein
VRSEEVPRTNWKQRPLCCALYHAMPMQLVMQLSYAVMQLRSYAVVQLCSYAVCPVHAFVTAEGHGGGRRAETEGHAEGSLRGAVCNVHMFHWVVHPPRISPSADRPALSI